MANQKKPKTPAEIREFLIDDSGLNRVILKVTDKTMVVWLKLKTEGARKRKIGTITRSTRTMVIKRDRSKHLLIKANAYGFNQYILESAKSFNTIRLSDQYHDWKIPVKDILEKGKFLFFKQQGFEVQRFMSLDELKPYLVAPETNTRF